MTRWRAHLETLGPVVPFDYEYMRAGRRRPAPRDQLIAEHASRLQEEMERRGPHVVLAGKSMGGRIGCHVSLTIPVAAVVCLGYPLLPARAGGKTDKMRDQVLLDMRAPVLFIQGTRDSLCPLELLEPVRSQMTAPNALHVVPTGDHSLEATRAYLKSNNTTQDELERETLTVLRHFLDRH
jgi:predicted alpha/beta-hydrolase family hydrolase